MHDHYADRVELHRFFREKVDKQPHELELCRRSPIYWIDRWCCIGDPRNVEQGRPYMVPFVLYDFQRELIEAIHGKPQTIHVDKSRDMGATWTVLAYCAWALLFVDGQAIKVFSAKREKVDNWTPDSLIGKLEFILGQLPDWMAKKGEHWERLFMRISCPRNPNNYILGESANEGIGRSGRYSLVFGDEFAFVPHSEQVYGSVMFTTNRFVMVSTPNGKANSFGRIKFSDPEAQTVCRLSFHWSRHPGKDSTWYEAEKKRIGDPVVIAQELELDYTASVRGRIYGDLLDPGFHLVDWPTDPDASHGRGWDYGPSSDPTVCLWYEVFTNEDGQRSIYIYREHTDEEQKQVADWHAAEVILRSLEPIDREWGDPAGDNRESDGYSYADRLRAASRTYAEQHRLDLGGLRHPINPSHRRMKLWAGISMVRTAIVQGRIFVSRDCPRTWDAMTSYRQRVTNEESPRVQSDNSVELIQPLHDWSSHYCDALRYIVTGELDDLRTSRIGSDGPVKSTPGEMVTSGMTPDDLSAAT